MRPLRRPGARIVLRPPTARDREEFLRLNRASRGLHRGLVSPPITSRQFAAYLERRRLANSPGFLICHAVNGAILGGINFSEIVRGNFRSAYLGYQIGEPFARRGYMTEALQLGAPLRVQAASTPPRGGEHPARQSRVDRPRASRRLSPRGLLASLPQDQRTLARSRAMGASRGRLARSADRATATDTAGRRRVKA